MMLYKSTLGGEKKTHSLCAPDLCTGTMMPWPAATYAITQSILQWVVTVRQIRKAREESPNMGAFIVKLCDILCGSGMPNSSMHVYGYTWPL